ncbi:MAG: hypothetical protein AB7U75_07180 [Hyphomicrobiaceae bacterium]
MDKRRAKDLDRRQFVGTCTAAACLSMMPLTLATPSEASQALSPELQDLAAQLAVQIERRQRHGEQCGKLMARVKALPRWSDAWWEERFKISKHVDGLFDAVFKTDTLIERILPIRSIRPADVAFQRKALALKAERPVDTWTTCYWEEKKRIEALPV